MALSQDARSLVERGAIQHYVAAFIHGGEGASGIARADSVIRSLFPGFRPGTYDQVATEALKAINAGTAFNQTPETQPPPVGPTVSPGRNIQRGKRSSSRTHQHIIDVTVDVILNDGTTEQRSIKIQINTDKILTAEQLKRMAEQQAAKNISEWMTYKGKWNKNVSDTGPMSSRIISTIQVSR